LAKTLAARHITVNAIAAGAFETKMMASTLESKKKKKRKENNNERK